MKIDALQKQYFGTGEAYAAALKMLQEYEDLRSRDLDWDTFEQSLNQLDGGVGALRLLDKLRDYYKAVGISQRVGGSEPPLSSDQYASLTSLVEQLGLSAGNNGQSINSIPMEKAFQEFINEKRVNWKPNSGMDVVYTKEVFPLFCELTSVQMTGELTIAHANAFKDAVLRYPANRRKMPRYRDLSLKEILNIEVPEADRLSKTTMQNYMDRLAGFLNWLGSHGYAQKELDGTLRGVVKKTSRSYEEKAPYSNEDLRKLFNSPEYVNGGHREAFKFWVPLLLLLTGARANEICQLFVDDVYKHEETGIWVIDINENDSQTTLKSIKKPWHARLVPLHPHLVKLGFLKYVEEMKAKGAKRLFEELPYRGDGNKYGDKAERWFNNTYTKTERNCDIKTSNTSMHSLRHNFVNCLAHTVRAQEHEYAYAIGQTPAGGVTTKRYMKPKELKEVDKLFKRVAYEAIDFDLIKPYNQQAFYRLTKTQAPSRKRRA